MTEASLAAQRLAVIAMRAYGPLNNLVPDLNIFDKSGRPERFPCVIVGESQVVGGDIDCADLSEVYLTFHAWAIETGLSQVKQIAGAVRRALRNAEGDQDGFRVWFNFEDAVFLRDPGGSHGHAVISFRVDSEELE